MLVRVAPGLMLLARTGSRELFTLCVIAAAVGIAYGSTHFFGVSFALGAFFAGMVLRESELAHRAAQESLPLRDAFAVLFFMGGMIGFFFFTTLYLQEELHFGPTLTGLSFLPATVVNFIFAMLLPRLTRRFDNAAILALGLALCVGGMAWLSRAPTCPTPWPCSKPRTARRRNTRARIT